MATATFPCADASEDELADAQHLNLVPCPGKEKHEWPVTGCQAELCNLAKFPKLNGKTVEVLFFDENKQRYKCLFPEGGDVNVRLENLKKVHSISPQQINAVKTLLEEGRLFEAHCAVQGVRDALEIKAELEALLSKGTYSELVQGRLVLADIPGKQKGYRAAMPIRQGDVLLFDTSFCHALNQSHWKEDMARQCRTHPDRQFFTQKIMDLTAGHHNTKQQRLVSILENNTFECTRQPKHVALFAAAARFNHSCCPNAVVDMTCSICIVRALRSIQSDEEVCISYVPVSDSYEDRQRRLAGKGFQCTCERCLEEVSSDPQLAVPCYGCSAISFSIQGRAKAVQVCESCKVSFDRDESLHNMRMVKEASMLARSAQPHPQELLAKLQAVKHLVASGIKNGVPPLHHESMHFLNNLANLHFWMATEVAGPHQSESLEAFYAFKRQALEVFEARHSRWTAQRDIDYYQVLSFMGSCSALSKEWKREWSSKLTAACEMRFGQKEIPESLEVSAPR